MMDFTKNQLKQLKERGAEVVKVPNEKLTQVTLQYGSDAHQALLVFIPDVACGVFVNGGTSAGIPPPQTMQVELFMQARRILQSYTFQTQPEIEALGGTFNCPIIPMPHAGRPRFEHAPVGFDDALARVANPGPAVPLIDGLESGTYIATATFICPSTVLNIIILRA
jgi:hypothetical protein